MKKDYEGMIEMAHNVVNKNVNEGYWVDLNNTWPPFYRKNHHASDLLAVRKLYEKKLAFCFLSLNLKYEEVSSLRE